MMRAMTHLKSSSCDGELCEGVSDENEGEHTVADVVARTTARAGGVAMPPPVGCPQP
jgi:hypothetical protein